MLLQNTTLSESLCAENATTYGGENGERISRKQAAKLLGKSPNALAIMDCRKDFDLQPEGKGKRVTYPKAVIEQLRIDLLRRRPRRKKA